MSFISDFKAFAMKGNVVDMAVGVIIGGAFGKIVSSLVDDVLMPLVGKVVGGADFTGLFVNLTNDTHYETLAAAKEAGVSVLAYGQFIQNIVDFLIVAFCIFLMLKFINNLNKKEEAPAPAPAPAPEPSKEEVLLTEIRDLLKEKK